MCIVHECYWHLKASLILFFLLTNYASVDQIPSPSKPIVLHINISTVNVTWSWQGDNDVQFLVQVSVGPQIDFVNASQPSDKYYLIYGDMSVNEVYIFQVFAYQNGILSSPSPKSDLLINGVNGECCLQCWKGFNCWKETFPFLSFIAHTVGICFMTQNKLLPSM